MEKINILSGDGFKPFKGLIDQGIPETLLEFKFSDGTSIRITKDHQFKVDDEFIQANLLYEGVFLSNKEVVEIKEIENKDPVYDVYDIDDNHSYYSNGVINHNCNIIFIDEFSFIFNDLEFYTSTYPVISSGKTTKVIIASTPNGMNLFHKLVTDAKRGLNHFVLLEYDWSVVPGRDEKWKETTISNTSEHQFRQEHECLFFGSTSTLIPGEVLELLQYDHPIEKSDNLSIYMKPVEDHIYITVVDVSEGIGKDYSTIQILDVTRKPYDQVVVFRSNTIDPLNDLPGEIFKISTKYNNAYVLIENNNLGILVAEILLNELEYENIVSDMTSSTLRLGVRTSSKTKSQGCSALKSLIVDSLLNIRDYATIKELYSFTKIGKSFQAEDSSKNDDLVMGLVLFSWLTRTEQFLEIIEDGFIETSTEETTTEDDEESLDFAYSGDDFIDVDEGFDFGFGKTHKGD